MVWFQKHARLNSPYSGYGRQFGAPGGSYEPESPIRRLTKDVYAQAKQGQVAAALSLLEQYEATYRNELDFWKCYIHCLSKLCWQDHSNFAQDEAWCALFEQRMQMLMRDSSEARNHKSFDEVLSTTNSFDQHILKALKSLQNLREEHLRPPQQVALLQQAKDAANSKNNRQALALYQEAMAWGPLPEAALNSVGWCIYRCIKEEIASPRVQLKQIEQLFGLYLQCCPEPQPGLLHSLMFVQLSNICKGINDQNDPQKEKGGQHFYGGYDFNAWLWLKHMDVLNTLQNEDLYSKLSEDGKEYDPLVIGLLRHVAKFEINQIKMSNKKAQGGERIDLTPEQGELANYLIAAISKYRSYDQSNNRIWLDYYQAQLLYWTQRYDEASSLYRSLVQQKSTEYWMWSSLAKSYAKQGGIADNSLIQKGAQCFAQAIMCHPQSSVLPSLYVQAAWVFKQCGYSSVAQFLKDEATKDIPWAPRASRARLWIGPVSSDDKAQAQDASPEDAAQTLIETLASEASAELYSELSWYHANLGQAFTQKPKNSNKADSGKGDERKRRTILVKYPGYELPLKISINEEPSLRKLPLGVPLEARVERDGFDSKGAPRFVVRQLRLRSSEQAESWDLVPLRALVITKVDNDAHKYHFRYNREIHGTLPFNLLTIKKGSERSELPLKPGAVFESRLGAQPRSGFVASICLDAAYPTNKDPLPEALNYVRSDED